MPVLEDEKPPSAWNGASSATKGAENASSTSQTNTNGDTPNAGGVWPAKQHRASIGRKIAARPPLHPSSTSLQSLSSQISSLKIDSPAHDEGEDHDDGEDPSPKNGDDNDDHRTLIAQVFEWLNQEKAKRVARKMHDTTSSVYHDLVPNRSPGPNPTRERSNSQSSEKALALDKLERILSQYSVASHSSSSSLRRKRSAFKKYRRGSASDSDYSDSEQAVPSVDATLDNSKTMAYTGGLPETETTTVPVSKQRSRDRENWNNFKSEIVRLAHTLRLRGWRRVPSSLSEDIEVVRLSGALTNAVYVVSPPKNLPTGRSSESSASLVPKKPPPKLLLRIYGPQVEHLIDRENELQILRRLGKKNIGPRVLGTFNNGRFEEYFHARTLTPKDLRNPETSKQIAKRMRELHDGIELLEEERQGGPFVWKNWDKWVDRCEQIITWLDKEIMAGHEDSSPQGEPWMKRGFVCGVPWPQFRKAVDSYRKWLHASYGGTAGIRQQLVFAHNDAQYGNLLRLEPSGESPLLLPANEHKQLVVIDFEYASANLRGMEFANHFTEWCYNYHDPERSFACNTKAYPTPEEQRRFIKAYVNHKPQGLPPSTSGTISPSPSDPTTSTASLARTNTHSSNPATISTPRLAPFMLDSNLDQQIPDIEAEQLREQATEADIQKLMQESRLWRVANSAQWVAWGIVQAKVPRMEKEMAAEKEANGTATADENSNKISTIPEIEKDEGKPGAHSDSGSEADYEEDDGFDYLAYAQDRALFFWADVLSLGLINENELPEGMVEAVKSRIIKY